MGGEPKPGDLLDGKYQLLRLLGRGGMGQVFEAENVRLGQRVAIKCLLPDVADNAEILARFEREARTVASLRSRHVVKIFDVSETVDHAPFMVMELLAGHDMQAEMSERGALPAVEVVDWIIQACSGLAEAHAAGVVHRDLKPSNVFLCQEPEGRVAKVLDFGIAKAHENAPAITQTNAGAFGTPEYMSPEQMRNQPVDARADVWALGVILYEALSGRLPFPERSFHAMAAAVVADEPTHLGELRPALRGGLAEVVMRALVKDRSRRTQSVGELAEALYPYGSMKDPLPVRLSALPSSSPAQVTMRMSNPTPSALPPETPASPVRGSTQPVEVVTEPPARRSRGAMVGAVAAVGALFVIGSAAIAYRVVTAGEPPRPTVDTARPVLDDPTPPSLDLASAAPTTKPSSPPPPAITTATPATSPRPPVGVASHAPAASPSAKTPRNPVPPAAAPSARPKELPKYIE